jgi:transposase
MSQEQDRWFVGVDWATESHEVCLLDKSGQVVGRRSVANTAVGLAGLCTWLLEVAGGEAGNVWVAIEVPRGVVVETLLERGFVVHAINPKQLDRFRDRFTVAGAKDDRLDARVLADSLRTDGHRFRRLSVDEPRVIELREWSRMAEDLRQEHVRLTNRVGEQLRRYYPQALELSEDLGAEWFLDLWELIPTPAKAAKARAQSVARVLKEHRVRRVDAKEVLRVLRQPAVIVAPGTTEAAKAHLGVLVARLRLINRELRRCHHRLDALCDELAGEDLGPEDSEGQRRGQRDVTILRSLPGVGRIVLATLLAEASQPLRARNYPALRSLCGVAPITKRSGKSRVVMMRHACHHRLRDALYHWGRIAIQRDEATRARYAELRRRGHSHGRALRSVSDRLLAVACAMLRNGTIYDPARHTAARKPELA